MSALYHYRSEVPEVVAAVKAMFKARIAVQNEGVEFAQRFGATGVVTAMFHERPSMGFAGVAWPRGKGPVNFGLWTLPTKNSQMRHPKPGGGAAGKALRAEWESNYPKLRADNKEWQETVGYSADNFWTSPGVSLKKGVVWIASAHRCTKNVTEVTTSEYLEATKDLKDKQ